MSFRRLKLSIYEVVTPREEEEEATQVLTKGNLLRLNLKKSSVWKNYWNRACVEGHISYSQTDRIIGNTHPVRHHTCGGLSGAVITNAGSERTHINEGCALLPEHPSVCSNY